MTRNIVTSMTRGDALPARHTVTYRMRPPRLWRRTKTLVSCTCGWSDVFGIFEDIDAAHDHALDHVPKALVLGWAGDQSDE